MDDLTKLSETSLNENKDFTFTYTWKNFYESRLRTRKKDL